MSVLKKSVLLCVLAAAVVSAQGQGAKVFPPTADQKAEIHKKLAELSARLAALGSNKTDPQLLAGLFYMGAGIALSLVSWARPRTAEAPLRARDRLTLLGVLLAGGFVAAAVPAKRAAGIDPAVALRSE